MSILVLEDKLGITAGYRPVWESMTHAAGLKQATIIRRSLHQEWRDSRPLMIQKGNRKAAGFNPDVMEVVGRMVRDMVNQSKCTMIICMDAAALGLVERDWGIATISNLRGGLYELFDLPFFVMTPIHAINSTIQLKDVRMLNAGVESREEWDEKNHGSDEMFIEPYFIPQGRWIFVADLKKAARIRGRAG